MRCRRFVVPGWLIALPVAVLAARKPASVVGLWSGGAPPDGPRKQALPTLTV